MNSPVQIENKNEGSDVTYYSYYADYNRDGLAYIYIGIDGETLLEVSGNVRSNIFEYTSSFISLHEGVLNSLKLRDRLSNSTDEIFDKIKINIWSFLERNNDMHVSDSYSYKNFLKQDNYPIYNFINAAYCALGDIAYNRRTKFKTPSFREIINEDLKDFVDDEFLNEYVSEYINKLFGMPEYLPENLFDCFSNFEVLESVRAEQSKFFKSKDNPKLNESLKIYQSMPSYYIEDSKILDSDEFDVMLKQGYINGWLQRFGIIDRRTELKVESVSGFGYTISLIKHGKTFHLNEMGYGFTQLIPIIIMIFTSKKNLFVIEEPESNLHPALQSLLADFFYEAVKYSDNQFIIETHSEYLIRKLQYLTIDTKSELNSDDSIIYYFSNPLEISKGQSQITKIKIQPDGTLSNEFGKGFFDEADNIALDIFLLKNSQKN
ncbi:MAG TPA: DUF3696 domain-containing protein [Parafilimonas sp.]|nr:DUF3696 domain-containing protein [Parafilimonas sp.]